MLSNGKQYVILCQKRNEKMKKEKEQKRSKQVQVVYPDDKLKWYNDLMIMIDKTGENASSIGRKAIKLVTDKYKAENPQHFE